MELRANHCPEPLRRAVEDNARAAIAEDLGGGDPSAALLDVDADGRAFVISRDNAVLAGRFWVDEVLRRVDPGLAVAWRKKDGERIAPGDEVCTVSGALRAIVSGERCALNLLQTLSGTATVTAEYVARAAGAKAVVLDTRKTLPGLRLAQKYAVVCGGGQNHRLDLAGDILIKENHIRACGSIGEAVRRARAAGGRVEVEVETADEAREALQAGADIILLDNFAHADIRSAVELINGGAEIEVSGNVTLDNIASIAACGVDRISVGALTKHLHAVDFSLQLPRGG